MIDSVSTANLNHDGLSDILYTKSVTSGSTNYVSLSVGLNKGQATFSTANYLIPSTYPTTDILTGDFNRDGQIDVALLGEFANGGDVALLLGTGGGALNKTPQFYQGAMDRGVVLDLNGDGAPDISGTTLVGVSRLLNTGHK